MEGSVRKIAYAGLFIAISVILTRFSAGNINIAGVFALRLSFGEVPIMLSGILLGPIYGAICGALADLIGFPLNPIGAYFPGYTLTAALAGLIPGLFSKFYHKEWNWWTAVAVVTLTAMITVPLNTLWLNIIHGKAYLALLSTRVIGKIVLIPIYVIIIRLVIKHSQYASLSSR